MPKRHLAYFLLLLLIILSVIAACAAPMAKSAGAPQLAMEQPAGEAVMAAATAAPAPAGAEEPGTRGSGGPAEEDKGAASSASGPDQVPLSRAERMVIKNAEVDLLVNDTSAALDQVLGVSSDVGGYVLNMTSWEEEGFKLAKVTLRMPADRYEEALRRLRRIGQVQKESSAGEDVTDQYVDLQSQLRNAEATAERLRSFLDKATKVEEALAVNENLKAVEAEIEQIKGRLNYLGDRAAYSTISIYLNPQRPTPTPTPTLTPTPTPTPAAWNPGRTAVRASGVLVDILKALTEAAIWLGIVGVPLFGVPVALVFLLGKRFVKKP